jgi:outer membrane immunogenic protein
MKPSWLAVALLAGACLAGPAMAADQGVPAREPVFRPVPPPPPVLIYTWTGCYLGIQGGGTFGRSRHDLVDRPLTDDFNMLGGLAGGTAGCNYQTGLLVVGAEGDLSWVSKTGEGTDLAPDGTPLTWKSKTRESWLGTARLRLGFAPDDRWLVYVTGGYAAARVEALSYDTLTTFEVSEARTRSGWTAGLGVEWMVFGGWSAKAEYLYVGLGNAGYFDAPPPLVWTRSNVRLENHVLRLGINFRFGAVAVPAVVAAY